MCDRVTMNCSGKHTAMPAACALRDWPTRTCLDPDHPLQQLIHRVVEEAAGERVAAVGTDGCGAPLMAISLTGRGAEAVPAVALPDGRALAFKVEDDAGRALGSVLARALHLMGVNAPVLERIGRAPLLGGGREVGEIRAAF
ncbi:hypothetical protein GCM10027074_41850 [Streptomyces deserti]